MARYKYNKEAVSGVIDQLNSAIDKLNDFDSEVLSGFSTIQSARGGEYLNISSDGVLKLKDISVEAIRKVIDDIRAKAQTIEEYNSASLFTKASSSIGMGFSKFLEGFLSAGENIIDGFATVGGLVAGIFSKDAKNAVGDFVKKDHVGDFFDSAYKGGFLSGIEKYSVFSSESTAANIFRGFGVASGYVASAALVGGTASTIGGKAFSIGAKAAANSLGYSATLTGIGGMGDGTENALQAGMDFNHAAFEGAKEGAVQAGTVVAFSKGTEVLGKGIQKIKSALSGKAVETVANSTDDVLKLTSGATDDAIKVASEASDDVLKLTSGTDDAIKAASGADATIASTTKYGSEKEFIDAVNSGKYNGDVGALRKDFKSTFGEFIKDGSREHELLSDAVQVARGKATSMYSTPMSGVSASASATTSSASATATSSTAATAAASSTGTMPLGLPSGSKAIAEITTPVSSLATVSPATSGLTDLVANVSKTGIPPALSVAPQYIDDGQRAIEQVSGELLGNFATPIVESTYVPGSMPVVDTPVQPDTVPMPTTSTPEPTVTTPTETIPTTNNPTTSTPTYTSPGPVYNSGGAAGGSYSTPAPVTSPSVPSEPIPVIDNPIPEPVQPVEIPVQPINISVQPISTPPTSTITDDISTIPTDETIIPDIPDDPIYKHQQTIRNSTTKSSNGLAKGVASTIIGLGAVGAAGAAGYGIYNKKKQEKEDEEE